MSTVSFPFTGHIHRLSFPGFTRPGQCYLKYYVNANGKAVFLCSQLRGHTGPSVTNAVTEIFKRVVDELDRANVFQALKTRRGWFRTATNLQFEAARTCRWVEHYPAGTGTLDEGSYSLVSFDSRMNPMWFHTSLAHVAAACGLPESFFDLSGEDLSYAAE